MKNTSRNINRKRSELLNIKTLIANLFDDMQHPDNVPQSDISSNNFARLRFLKTDLIKIKNSCNDIYKDILHDYERKKHLPVIKKQTKYKNDEASFRTFQAQKKQFNPESFLEKNNIPLNEIACFENVESMLEYEIFTAIYVIKDGKCWEYEPFQHTTRKYVCFHLHGGLLMQNDDLEKVEHALFLHYLKHH